MNYYKILLITLIAATISIAACGDDDTGCVESTWYEDADGDGLGNADVSQSACEQPSGFVLDNSDTDDTGSVTAAASTPVSAFDDFNSDAVTVSFDGASITIESDGLPNHTSPFWASDNSLYIDPIIADPDAMSPGAIRAGDISVTVPAAPEKATTSSATGLGAIGIAVTGAPIFNGQEGPTASLTENIANGFDYAGGHMGPTGYHYHTESVDIEENTTLSVDDEKLVGIMSDGFLIYGRKCNATDDYPTDLDTSGGHSSATQHSEGEEFYHYHIINEFYIGSYILLFENDLQGTPNSIR